MMLRRYILLLLAALLTVGSVSSPLYAQDEPQQKETEGWSIPDNGAESNCNDKYEGKLLAVIVPCIRDVVQETATNFVDEFDEFLKAPIYAFITLVVVMFGVKVLSQDADLKKGKESFVFLMKLGVVLLMIENFGGFVPAAYGTLQEGTEIVTSTLADNASIECSELPGEAPWNYLDCSVAKLMGFAPETYVGASALAIAGTAIWSGQFGVMMFIGITAVFFFILRLVINAAYTYLMTLVVLAFMIIISPIFIPMILLQVTSQYFDQWLRSFVALLIMPAIVMAYLTLSFTVLDKILHDPEFGAANLLSKEAVEEYHHKMESSTNETTMVSDAEKQFEERAQLLDCGADAYFNPSNPTASCGTQIGTVPGLNELYTFDFRSDEAGKGAKIFFGLIALVITAYLLEQLLGAVMSMAQLMLGGAYFMSALVTSDNPLQSGNPAESALAGAQQGMNSQMQQALKPNGQSGVQGAANQAGQFLSAQGGMPGAIIQGMVGNRR